MTELPDWVVFAVGRMCLENELLRRMIAEARAAAESLSSEPSTTGGGQ